mgnify:CR=1 FL=1
MARLWKKANRGQAPAPTREPAIAANARVRLGRVERAVGPGPSGRGWSTDPDLPPEWLEKTLARLEREPPTTAVVWAAAGRAPKSAIV